MLWVRLQFLSVNFPWSKHEIVSKTTFPLTSHIKFTNTICLYKIYNMCRIWCCIPTYILLLCVSLDHSVSAPKWFICFYSPPSELPFPTHSLYSEAQYEWGFKYFISNIILSSFPKPNVDYLFYSDKNMNYFTVG